MYNWIQVFYVIYATIHTLILINAKDLVTVFYGQSFSTFFFVSGEGVGLFIADYVVLIHVIFEFYN